MNEDLPQRTPTGAPPVVSARGDWPRVAVFAILVAGSIAAAALGHPTLAYPLAVAAGALVPQLGRALPPGGLLSWLPLAALVATGACVVALKYARAPEWRPSFTTNRGAACAPLERASLDLAQRR